LRIIRHFYHFLLAWLASAFYGAPSKKIAVVGVTGTKGKSTVLEMLDSILTAAHRRTALLSSVRLKIGSRSGKNFYANTMPGRGAIQKFLKEAVAENCEIALIEVTSEGVKQSRHRFIHWDGAVFLNLHPEHIEAHGGFEKYREAKLDFFRALSRSAKPRKFFVVNADDQNAPYFEEAARGVAGGEVFLCRRPAASLVKKLKEQNPDWLLADFNIENVAVAAKTAGALGAKEKEILVGLENFRGLRGRMDFVQKKPFAVVVDYAHTPDSLRAVYEILRRQASAHSTGSGLTVRGVKPSKAKGHKLICVLGSAGGGRDKWKRPELGRIASHYCDRIILTDEDPYDENPMKILEEIKSGIPDDEGPLSKVEVVLDRKEAIRRAILSAQEGDVVAVTGKGSEEWIHVASGRKIPWDDRGVVEEILSKING